MNIKAIKSMIVEAGIKLGDRSTKNCCCLAMYEPKVPTIHFK